MADAASITLFEQWVVVSDNRSNRVYVSKKEHLSEFVLLDIEKCYPGLKTMGPSSYVFNKKLYLHANYGHVIIYNDMMECDGYLSSSSIVAPLKAVNQGHTLLALHTGIPGITQTRSIASFNAQLDILAMNDRMPEDAFSRNTYNIRNAGGLATDGDFIYYIHGFGNHLLIFDSTLKETSKVELKLPSLIKPPSQKLAQNNIQLNPKERADLFLNSSFITQLFVNETHYLVHILIQPGARKKLGTTLAHSLQFFFKETNESTASPMYTPLRPIALHGNTLTSAYANEDGGLILYTHEIVWN